MFYKLLAFLQVVPPGAKKNAERPILTECLGYSISNNVKILLLSELSCLGRDVDEVLKNVMLCKENKLNVYFQKENLSIFDDSGKEHPFLTIFIAILGTVAQMERENIKFRLDSVVNSINEVAASSVERPATANLKKRKQSSMPELSSYLREDIR